MTLAEPRVPAGGPEAPLLPPPPGYGRAPSYSQAPVYEQPGPPVWGTPPPPPVPPRRRGRGRGRGPGDPSGPGGPPRRRRRGPWLAVVAVLLVLVGAGTAAVLTRLEDSPAGVGPLPAGVPTGTIVRPQSFGAVGDGSHDDAPAIQHAIDQAAGNGTVLLAPGTYLCKSRLQLPSHTKLLGESADAVLKFEWTTGTLSDTSGPYLSNLSDPGGSDDITVSNLTLQGGGDGNPSGKAPADGLAIGMRFYLARALTLTHLTIENTPGDATSYFGVDGLTVTDNAFKGIGRGAVDIHWSNEGPNKDITVQRNTVDGAGDDVIAVNGSNNMVQNTTGTLAQNILISDNTLTGWATAPNENMQGHGIALLGVDGAVVRDNTIRHIPESGILVRGGALATNVNPNTGEEYVSADIEITGNTISDIGYNAENSNARSYALFRMDGVEVSAGHNITVTGNSVSNVVQTPVNVNACTSCTVKDN